MAKAWDAVVVSDVQIPFHDPQAFKCFLRIGKQIRAKKLVINGDWLDFANLSTHMKNLRRNDLLECLDEEIEVGRSLFHETIDTLQPEEVIWLDGNHENRMERALAMDGQMTARLKQIFKLDTVQQALKMPALMDFAKYDRLIKKYITYPHGTFLHGGLHTADDVWIEHGYMSGVKAGLLAQKLLERRMCSVIVGHGEKLALVNRKTAGYRTLFAIENGNLSKLAEPSGEDCYSGVPHAASEYMDHRQGFSVIHYDGQWWPEIVPIFNGKSYFHGTLFKA